MTQDIHRATLGAAQNSPNASTSGLMDKKSLTERDICTKYVVPAIQSAGWDIQSQLLEQYHFTDGQVHVRGKKVNRGKQNLLTFCCHSNRTCRWQSLKPKTAWLVGRYVIMPGHIHLFAAATSTKIEFKNWVKYWKSQFTKRHKVADHRWQTDDWDTRMRTGEQYEEK